jgi:hypothetical protein
MKIVFDVDLKNDNLDEKLRQLKDLENAILMRMREAKSDRLLKEGETWLRSLPEKPFY